MVGLRMTYVIFWVLLFSIRLRQINNLQPAATVLLAVGLLFESGSLGVYVSFNTGGAGFWQFLDSVPGAEEGLHGIADRREFVFQIPLRLELAGTEGNIVCLPIMSRLDFRDDRVFEVLGGHWCVL